MKKIVKCLLVGTLSAAMIFSVVACGGSSTAETTAAPETEATEAPKTEAPETEAPETEAPETEAPETQAPVDGEARTLLMGADNTPELDPAVANDNSGVIAFCNVNETLVYPGKEGIEPRLAESWEISDDSLTYTFHLVQGAKFHNGEEVKASDVVFSMNRVMTMGEGYAWLWQESFDSIEAPDDYTVVINLKTPVGPFLWTLIHLGIVSEKEVMAHIDTSVDSYGEFGDYAKTWMSQNDAGCGAYMVREIVPQDYCTFDRFDDWYFGWEDHPYAPTEFTIKAVQEGTTVLTMMANRTMDISDQWRANETYDQMEAIDGVSIAVSTIGQVQYIYMNSTKAPLDDVNFRRAMNYLIDYEAVNDYILPRSGRSYSPVCSNIPGYTETEAKDYKQDVEKAKELIAQSKYADSYGDYVINIDCISGNDWQERVALSIQSAGQQIGLNFEISKTPWVSVVDELSTAASTPHMISVNSCPPYPDAGAVLQMRYHSQSHGSWEQGEWLDTPELDQMINEAMQITDDQERYAVYADLQNYIMDTYAPSCLLAEYVERFGYQSDYIVWPAMETDDPSGVAGNYYGYSHCMYNIEVHNELK